MGDSQKYPARIPRGFAKIEEKALEARRKMGVGILDPVMGEEFLQMIGTQRVLVDGRWMPISYAVEPHVMTEAETYYDPELDKIICALSVSTYEALEDGDPRAQHTAIHEGGHAILHGPEVFDLQRMTSRQIALHRGEFQELKAYQDVEWQAHCYAGAVRAPGRGLEIMERELRLTVENMMKQFKMSGPAAEVRFEAFRKHREKILVAR